MDVWESKKRWWETISHEEKSKVIDQALGASCSENALCQQIYDSAWDDIPSGILNILMDYIPDIGLEQPYSPSNKDMAITSLRDMAFRWKDNVLTNPKMAKSFIYEFEQLNRIADYMQKEQYERAMARYKLLDSAVRAAFPFDTFSFLRSVLSEHTGQVQ